MNIFTKNWAEFFNLVQNGEGYENRLEVMRLACEQFSTHDHFSHLTLQNRRWIAGLEKAPIDYGWFGGMTAAGRFQNRINENDPQVSLALDIVPRTGPISRRVYLDYIDEYCKAFPKGGHGIATATRLLAMKRPDWFVCIARKNREALLADFGVRSNRIGYDKYWSSIIDRIIVSPWWRVASPASAPESEVWMARAAFLDSIYFGEL